MFWRRVRAPICPLLQKNFNKPVPSNKSSKCTLFSSAVIAFVAGYFSSQRDLKESFTFKEVSNLFWEKREKDWARFSGEVPQFCKWGKEQLVPLCTEASLCVKKFLDSIKGNYNSISNSQMEVGSVEESSQVGESNTENKKN